MAVLPEVNSGCVIRLERVSAGYEGDTVLEDINLKVDAQDYIALIEWLRHPAGTRKRGL